MDTENKEQSLFHQEPESDPRPLTGDDDVVALDNTAFKDNQWKAEFVISVFNKLEAEKLREKANKLLTFLGIDPNSVIMNRIGERSKFFFAEPQENVEVTLCGDDKRDFVVGPTRKNGILSYVKEFGKGWNPSGEYVNYSAVDIGDEVQGFSLTTRFSTETGWGIISDIDDTIKVSEVLREHRLLYNTFIVERPLHVEGMPAFYQQLQQLYNATFFYLSASPWQLYLFLHEFLDENKFPHGTVILREMTFREFSSLFNSWMTSPKEYKIERMRKIHSWFPNRKFICIGDSTQSDPEAYGQIYHEFPGWIEKIWIHIVTGVNPKEEKSKNAPERFQTAFTGIPTDVWTTFESPSELAGHLPSPEQPQQG